MCDVSRYKSSGDIRQAKFIGKLFDGILQRGMAIILSVETKVFAYMCVCMCESSVQKSFSSSTCHRQYAQCTSTMVCPKFITLVHLCKPS